MNKIEELKKIKQMLDDGILSESEYTLLKSEIIDSVPVNNSFTSKNVEIENDNQLTSGFELEDIETQEEELPIVKAHFNKKGVVLFFSIIVILVAIYQLNDKGLINFKNRTEISDDSIKDLTDLETYLNREADNYCDSWHKAIAYNNEQRKYEEWVRLDGRILYFETQIIPLLVKNNDLPDEYVKKGADFFNKRLSSCGYYYYGGSPPDTTLNESNKNNESQAIEPLIINHENNSTDNPEDSNDMSSNIKSADELEVADKKLNSIYKQVIAVLNETEKTELKHEQRKWIKYRDISCEEETKNMNGSLYNAFLNNCKKEITENRIEELNDILQFKQ